MSTTQPIRNTEQLNLFKDYYRTVKPNHRNYALLIVGLNTALRISDLLYLTCGMVYDFGRKRWRTHIVLTEQKTGKENRIYINQEFIRAIEAYVDFSHKTEASWLFESQIQKELPVSRHQAFRIIKEAAAYANLGEEISCHSLRKTFGYHAWKQGTEPALLMAIYNHSSYEVTKRYLGIEQDDKDAVFEKIQL